MNYEFDRPAMCICGLMLLAGLLIMLGGCDFTGRAAGPLRLNSGVYDLGPEVDGGKHGVLICGEAIILNDNAMVTDKHLQLMLDEALKLREECHK